MYPNTVLRIPGDVSVVVPDSLDLITCYVLREQQDWFEDEIRFVRELLRPGQTAVDIGANYGLFTLSIAKAVGPAGRVWAFEPASTTARTLAESLEINGFQQVVLDCRAVSDHAGTEQLTINGHSECNALVRGADATGNTESVSLVTLDEAMREHRWTAVDFVKIDAEGEEAAIIRGGREFLKAQSPLIQYEIKAGQYHNLELVRSFSAIGYESYRLVPGLGALVPFNVDEIADAYLLNLYCCKPDRAAMLAAAGRLVLAHDTQGASHALRVDHLLHGGAAMSSYGWRKTLTRFPYGRALSETWQKTASLGRSGEVEKALALHAISHDEQHPIAQRCIALATGLKLMLRAVDTQTNYLRRSSLARIAQEFGARQVAVKALDELIDGAMTQHRLDISEPFLTSSIRHDQVDPKNAIADWVVCSSLEELERNSSYSSFYAPHESAQRLTMIRDLGYGSPEMSRRLELIEKRFASTLGN